MNDLEVRSQIVDALSATLRRSLNLSDVPGLVEECLKRDAWREFRTERGEIVRYGELEFRDFLCTPPLRGLGGSEDAFLAVLRAAGHHKLADRVTELLATPLNPPGNPNGKLGNTKVAKNGAVYRAQRLKRDAPALAAKVAAGKISAHAAAVKAGIRRRYIQVRADDIDRALSKLIEFYTPDEIRGALKRAGR